MRRISYLFTQTDVELLLQINLILAFEFDHELVCQYVFDLPVAVVPQLKFDF